MDMFTAPRKFVALLLVGFFTKTLKHLETFSLTHIDLFDQTDFFHPIRIMFLHLLSAHVRSCGPRNTRNNGFLLLDEAIASRAVIVIVFEFDGWAVGNAFGVS